MMALGDEEKQVADALGQELQRHAELTLRAFGAVGMAFERAAAEVRPSRVVTSILLARLANDLRCVALLALRGYPLQAATLVASMFEAARSRMSAATTRARKTGSHTMTRRSP